MIEFTVNYNRLIEKLRFDVDFYKPEFSELEEVIKKTLDIKPFKHYIVSITNGVDVREFVSSGIPYLRIGNMKELFIDINSASKIRINKTFSKKIDLKDGDLLFSRKGTIGRVCIVTPDSINSIISTELIKVRIEGINPYYTAVYFLSKYGQMQLMKISSGAVNQVITREFFESIYLFIPPDSFQKSIEDIVKEAYERQKLANKNYKQAQKLLNETLGLDKLKIREEKIFEAKYGDITHDLRLDVNYYLPKFTSIIDFLKQSKLPLKKLKELYKEKIRSINPSQYPNKKFIYIEIGDVDVFSGEIKPKEILGHEAPPNATKLLKKGDLIISMVRPTRGAITIIPEEFDNSVGSTAFYVLEVPSPFKEFLFLYLRSDIGLIQLGRPVVGAMYPTLKKTHIDEIIIPVISEEIQKEISNYIIQSFSLRKDSKKLIEKAKKDIENFIEKKVLN